MNDILRATYFRLSLLVVALLLTAQGIASGGPIGVQAQGSRAPQTFTVTNTNDAGDGSLRAAIVAANVDTSASSVDTIVFDIDGAPPHVIKPLTGLPTITGPLTIDGFCVSCDGSTPNSAANDAATNATYTVVISGEDRTTGSGSAFTIDAGLPVTIRGLVINNWSSSGINHTGGTGHIIAGNFIGTDVTGMTAQPNGTGISGHRDGITVGGNNPADRNVISGNDSSGVRTCFASVPDPGTQTVVKGNFIGVNAAGTSALPNSEGVTVCHDRDWLIEGNVISGNEQDGIAIGVNAINIRIVDNIVGLNRSASAAVPNGQTGIVTSNSASNVTIGEPGAGNTIAGNEDVGIYILGAGGPVDIFSNWIGVSPSGAPFGNGLGGIRTSIATQLVRIGDGTAAGANTIASNGAAATPAIAPGGAGVYIFSTDPAAIANVVGNVIHGNAGIPIDLGGGAGPTPNDVGDADTGGNQRQNFPVLLSAVRFDQGLKVAATLSSSPSQSFTINVYSTPSCPGGKPELRTYLGQLDVSTSAGGTGSSTDFVALAPAGHMVSATASDTAGRTSEVGACIPVIERPAEDANCDGNVDALDAVAILRYLVGFGLDNIARTCNVDPIAPAADANGDTEETVQDALFVRRGLAGLN